MWFATVGNRWQQRVVRVCGGGTLQTRVSGVRVFFSQGYRENYSDPANGLRSAACGASAAEIAICVRWNPQAGSE
ncbi:hypothetical protein GCM10022212_04830 [Actimicrobium antarcticum]|uniref:Uncharacterized protein n=1 Tax=Actimicrobium antarcticum TaxID=1051899 RepID=A0ABP7SNH4_9BURK